MTRFTPGPPRTARPRRRTICTKLLAACLIPAAAGCNNATLRDAQDAYRQGNLAVAGARIDAYVASDGEGGNQVIAYLEQGTVRRAQGDYAASNESFAVVNDALTRIDNAPEVSLSRETLAAVTNLNALPYRGYHYDRVMLNTFRALNYLEMGQRDEARVELRRAYQRQVEAVQANAERLEKAREEAQASKTQGNYDAQRAQDDPTFQNNLDAQYNSLNRYAAYGDYVNPFTEWMQGVYYLGEAADGSDLEWSRKAFERVAGMAPDNDYVRDDYAASERISAGGRLEPTTYVVFATGTAPSRGEIRIDIPLFILDTGRVDYVGANFPRLVENPVYVRQLQVRTDRGTYPTQVLCDMDQVVGREFKNELPIVITKTLIAAGTKATIAYALRRSAEENGSGGQRPGRDRAHRHHRVPGRRQPGGPAHLVVASQAVPDRAAPHTRPVGLESSARLQFRRTGRRRHGYNQLGGHGFAGRGSRPAARPNQRRLRPLDHPRLAPPDLAILSRPRSPVMAIHRVTPLTFSLAALTLTAGLLAGCQGVNQTQRAEPRAEIEEVDTKKLNYDGTLNQRAAVIRLNDRTLPNGFLQVQAEIRNRTLERQIVNYRFDWIDSSGMQVRTNLSNWKTLSLAAKENRLILGTAPTKDVVDFRLSLIEPKGTW